MGKYKRMKLDQTDPPSQDFTDSEDDGENKDRKRKAPRSSANARERARMRVLSKAFVKLKTTLPWVPADTKLSKLDTLRLAACYISHLRCLLNPESPVQATSPRMPNPLSMTWPFSLNGDQKTVPQTKKNSVIPPSKACESLD